MKIGIVAGEASGDILGAGLLHSLQQPAFTASGVGGTAMLAQGFQSLFDINRLSVMGLIEPLFHLRDLLHIRRELARHFLQQRPNVFVGIDSPDFNLGLEMQLRAANIPVVHYVSPSVWAWRQKRIHKIAKAVDMMLTLFPFEADFYKKHKVPVTFVGHPLADTIPLQPDKLAARAALGLDSKTIYIAVLPGSRRNELKYLSDVFIRTAERVWRIRPDIQFITSAINNERNNEFQQNCKRLAPGLPMHFFERRSHEVLAAADVVLVASGTATLETLLFKRPMVIAYKMAGLTYQIAKHVVKLSYVGLPNLLANQLLVPEFIQDNAEPEKLAGALLDYLDHPEKMDKLEKEFLGIHQSLRCNASEKAAGVVRGFE